MATKKKIRIYSVDPNTGEALKDQILYPETSTECIIDPQTGKKLSTDLKNIDQAISKEVTDRQTAINEEAEARSQADNTLDGKITDEVTARENADTTLQGNIDVEAIARGNADDALQSDINTHKNNKNNPHEVTKTQVGLGNVANTGDSATPSENGIEKFTTGGAYTLKSDLHQEVVDEATARGNADTRIEGKIDTHIADVSNPHSVTAAQVGLGNVTNTGDSDTPVENGTDKFTTGGAYTLKTNLEQADSDLGDRIDNEVRDREDADETLQGNIDDEVTRATDAEEDLSDRIDNLASTVSDDYTELDGKLDDFIDNTKIENSQIIINRTGLPYGTSGNSTLVQTDANGKLSTAVLPDAMVGQMIYGGTVEFEKEQPSDLNPTIPIAELSKNAKTKLGLPESTTTLTLIDSPSGTGGYVANENIYYICKNNGNFANISYLVGDWLVATNSAWDKIENTDAVKLVNNQVGNVYIQLKIDGTKVDLDPAQKDIIADLKTSTAHPYNATTNKLATVDDIPDIRVNGTTIAPVQDIIDITTPNADWNANSGVSQILNKPNLATVAETGDYDDLIDKPDLSIYAQSADLATVATSGDYGDLSNTPEANTVETPSVNLTNLKMGTTVYNIPQGEIYTAGSGIDITNNVISIATGICYTVEVEGE